MIGKRIKALREERGISQRDLANLCQISKSSIDAYETERRNPKREALEAIADVFNVDIEYLQGKTDVRNSVANSLGFASLEEWYKKTHAEPKLSEGEEMLLDLFRRIPEEQQKMVLDMIRAALNTLQ